MPYIGSHINEDDILVSVDIAKLYKLNCLQIFLHDPKERKINHLDTDTVSQFSNDIKQNNINLFVHSSFMINIARPWDKYTWWINNLIDSIKLCHRLGAKGIVLHFGKKLDIDIKHAYNNMFTSLVYVISKTKKYKDIMILLETPARQGTEMCYTIDDLAYFYNKFKRNDMLKNRIKICIDTCHIFAAGHDIKTSLGITTYISDFDKKIGLDNIKLIHLNDSYHPFDSHIDRHDNIGKGYIGSDSLQIFYNFFKNRVPIILETPSIDREIDISILHSWNNK